MSDRPNNRIEHLTIERLTELELRVQEQEIRIERLAKHVSKLSDGLSQTLAHLKGFFESVAVKLPIDK